MFPFRVKYIFLKSNHIILKGINHMATYKCKMCGGALDISNNESVATCDYCGTQQTVPTTSNEVIANLFNRANNLRMKCEFDKAAQLYEKIVQENDSEAEAHWGLVLCKYGIEYVEDPQTYTRVPTCHRTLFESVITDAEYNAAIDYSDSVQQKIYESEARAIDKLQKDILAIVKNEEPFDVFICYKESDENGKRTVDSVIANDIYHQLTQEGFKVFYAAITLEDKLGQEYEPYIFAALNSSKVMLSIGTKPEYFNAVWVKNEWSRYMNLMKTDRSKLLIPCYRDMDAYDLPEEFAHLQAQDMSKIGFINDVVRGIKKVIEKEQTAEPKEKVTGDSQGNDQSLLERVRIFLEDGEWERVDEYCEKVLDRDPKNAYAYLYKLMADLKLRRYEDFSTVSKAFDENSNYLKLVRFADEKNKKDFELCFQATSVAALKEKQGKDFSIKAGSLSMYRGEDSVVYVPSEVTEISDSSFMCEELTELIISSKKLVIAERAFRFCSKLKKIRFEYDTGAYSFRDGCLIDVKNKTLLYGCGECVIPSDGSVTRIGDDAFSGNESIKRVVIPDSVTEVGGYAFVSCSNLENVVIPKSVTKISDGCFCDCKKLESITVEQGNTAFEVKNNCLVDVKNKALLCGFAEWTIPDDGSVERLGAHAFNENKKYSRVIVPKGVRIISSQAFSECSELKELILPDTLTEIAKDAFKYCENLVIESVYNGVARESALAQGIEFREDAALRQERIKKLVEYREKIKPVQSLLAWEWPVLLGVKQDGSVVACDNGNNLYGVCNVENWENVTTVVHSNRSLGLTANGLVYARGDRSDKKCDVHGWKNIVEIAGNYDGTVGLRSDGTVVACGKNEYGQFNVENWTEVRHIVCGLGRTYGVRSDGTVLACGDNGDGQCNVTKWKDISNVVCSARHTVGIHSNGKVEACGENEFGQLNVNEWTDIVDVACSTGLTVGLRSDGTVVACGDNKYGQCNVTKWTDIIKIVCSSGRTLGLRSDGTVVACGDNRDGGLNLDGWTDIVDIVHDAFCTVGLKKDGTLIVCCREECGGLKDSVSDFKLFKNFETYEEDRKAFLDVYRKERGVCRHCGGAFKGLFSKTCSNCGNPKDY